MSSETRTSMKVLPLCTPNLKPTISGAICERRDQVLITSVVWGFLPSIFLRSFSSTYGPLDTERDMDLWFNGRSKSKTRLRGFTKDTTGYGTKSQLIC